MKQLKGVGLGFFSFLVISALIVIMSFLIPSIIGSVTARYVMAQEFNTMEMRMIRGDDKKTHHHCNYANCNITEHENQDNKHGNMVKTHLSEKQNESIRQPMTTQVYDIKPGDNLCEISRMYGVSVDEISSYNLIRDSDLIYAGSSLVVPAKAE